MSKKVIAHIELTAYEGGTKGELMGSTVALLGLILNGISQIYKNYNPQTRDAIRFAITEAVVRSDSPVWDLDSQEGDIAVFTRIKQ